MDGLIYLYFSMYKPDRVPLDVHGGGPIVENVVKIMGIVESDHHVSTVPIAQALKIAPKLFGSISIKHSQFYAKIMDFFILQLIYLLSKY